jgi:hypothetical protein
LPNTLLDLLARVLPDTPSNVVEEGLLNTMSIPENPETICSAIVAKPARSA